MVHAIWPLTRQYARQVVKAQCPGANRTKGGLIRAYSNPGVQAQIARLYELVIRHHVT
jgi:hypothetical protein